MKVLFDHQTFSIQRFGGISRYFVNLNKSLNQLPDVSSKIVTLYSENEYLKGAAVPLNNNFGKKLFTGHFNRIYRWNRRYSLLHIRRNNFDVFHPTYYDPYFIPELKKPFVITVHDMIHELMPDLFSDNAEVVARKKALINNADAIIAISDYTRNDILRFYPEAASKITVIHHGYNLGEKSTVNTTTYDNYILYVGERAYYKNFTAFVTALAPLLNEDKALQLICTGGRTFTADEQQLLNTLNIAGQCKQLDVTDDELRQLYSQARLFVFPSYLEGFGLPLLEAFHAGCPVAAANASCFPEIGGDAVAWFDPHNEESIRNTVQAVLNDDVLRNSYVTKGHERLKQFTLEKQVAQTLQVYKSITG